MKIFKMTDLAVQAILITVFAVMEIVRRDSTFITGYFVVGGWQIISMVIHFINKWHPYKSGHRYNYQVFVACVFLLLCLSAVTHLMIYLLYFLLFASPFMAIYYTWICYREVFYYSKRPLELI